jgi:hypothetical protein
MFTFDSQSLCHRKKGAKLTGTGRFCPQIRLILALAIDFFGQLVNTGILHFERKVTLQQVADDDDNSGRNDLRKDGMQVEEFNQKPQQDIIDEKIRYKHEKITEQLYPAPDIGIYEHHKLHEQKSHREVDEKGEDKRGYVGLESIKTQVDHLLMEKESIAKRVKQETQYCIATTAGSVAKGLQGHPLPEWRVKEVDNRSDEIMNHAVFLQREDNTSALYSS